MTSLKVLTTSHAATTMSLAMTWWRRVPSRLRGFMHMMQWYHHHDDVIKWNFFRVTGHLWGIHRSPVNSPHKGQCKQWRGWWFDTPSRPLWRHCNDWSLTAVDIWSHDDTWVHLIRWYHYASRSLISPADLTSCRWLLNLLGRKPECSRPSLKIKTVFRGNGFPC